MHYLSPRLLYYVLLLLDSISLSQQSNIRGRRKPMRYPRNTAPTSSPNPRMSIANMTCAFYEQPLNHFVPKGKSPTYQQRYCWYDGYTDVKNQTAATPIFLYTGNESPLEEYINNTGLIWELAPEFRAQVVFMEHRYEGRSIPQNLSEACMSYSSSIQVLADYVQLLDYLNPQSIQPVIAFGGSYGGMLSSWLRMKYPDVVAGAIAGSAPIFGFPRTAAPDSIDASARVVTRALSLPYPPTDKSKVHTTNHCVDNLLAAWPLVTFMGRTEEGREALTESFRLCRPLETTQDIKQLLDWAQSPWFDMAEGSFPYPSSYIPFALHMGENNLPAWNLQSSCWKNSTLHKDWNVRYTYPEGLNRSSLRYNISYGDTGLVLNVDWDTVSEMEAGGDSLWTMSSAARGLLTSLRDAVAVWYNVTLDKPCFNTTPAENDEQLFEGFSGSASSVGRQLGLRRTKGGLFRNDSKPAQICYDKMASEGSWGPLFCNEDVNLVIVVTNGLGHDFYWPPRFPRGTKTYLDIVNYTSADDDEYCADPNNTFGYPTEHDPWSTWLDLYYGGLRIGAHSNIVFSNGLLDPWSAAGVYAPGKDPTPTKEGESSYDGPMVQNITLDGSIVSVLIEFGGHHTDLMYSDPKHDPECVKEARRIETRHIQKWIDEWRAGKQGLVCQTDKCSVEDSPYYPDYE